MAKSGRKSKPKPEPIDPGDTPTPAQLVNGTYELASLPSPDNSSRIAKVHINRGGTPVARWASQGRLTDTQALAIATCIRLWALVGTDGRTTANYGQRIAGQANEEHRMAMLIAARGDLYRIQDYVPKPYWDCFEMVCRFDEPAGVAGSRLGFGNRSAQDRAHMIVCQVADTIAMREGMVAHDRVRVA